MQCAQFVAAQQFCNKPFDDNSEIQSTASTCRLTRKRVSITYEKASHGKCLINRMYTVGESSQFLCKRQGNFLVLSFYLKCNLFSDLFDRSRSRLSMNFLFDHQMHQMHYQRYREKEIQVESIQAIRFINFASRLQTKRKITRSQTYTKSVNFLPGRKKHGHTVRANIILSLFRRTPTKFSVIFSNRSFYIHDVSLSTKSTTNKLRYRMESQDMRQLCLQHTHVLKFIRIHLNT